ncbi:Fic family protein [Patescibacteria group bacterium]|nr:Fic family protein [Patescibacteria group bacterium]
MKISEKLQIIKRLSGLTQEQLAKKLETSFATLNSWINERSVPRKKAEEKIDTLYKEYTGQKIIPADILLAKKKIIYKKNRLAGNILKLILKRQDIYDSFMLLLTYNSNSIEGSTLSENETAQILFQNLSIPNKSLIEQMEAKNHQAAWKYLITYLEGSSKFDEALIFKLHSILMNGIRDDAGFYRRNAVRIVGANVPTANYIKVPDLMEDLVKVINFKRGDVILHNTEIHSRFEQIHPFSDGNGRIGRLLMTAMLLKNNLPPAIIRQEKKQLYYAFLKKAQTQGDMSLLEDFICEAILEGFDILEI